MPSSENIPLHDAYMSVVEALKHGGIANRATVTIKWVNSERVTKTNVGEFLGEADGIIVPGGFGIRGINGMIYSIQYARENNIPILASASGCSLQS